MSEKSQLTDERTSQFRKVVFGSVTKHQTQDETYSRMMDEWQADVIIAEALGRYHGKTPDGKCPIKQFLHRIPYRQGP
jgi:hypothetical protein